MPSKSSQLDFDIPATKITGRSNWEFVGLVASEPLETIIQNFFIVIY